MSPGFPILFLAAALGVSTLPTAQKARPDPSSKDAAVPAVIWRDPGEVSTLDLLNGAGGREHGPDPNGRYTFIQEDQDGTSPKFSVRDAAGTEWKVKLGPEVQCETAATRLLWAVGYFVEEDYYLSQLTVDKLPTLRRGRNLVGPDGIVKTARLKRRSGDITKRENWHWFDNPFLKSREFNGLRVMMSFLNNWDLKDVNNTVYHTSTERRYLVSDVGATFGNTGNYFTRSKNERKEYARSAFVSAAHARSVDFVLHDRPFFLTAIDVVRYRRHARMEQIVKHIPLEDARWLGRQLSKLSDEQIKDCFRSAGYRPEEVDAYADVVRNRIAALNAL